MQFEKSNNVVFGLDKPNAQLDINNGVRITSEFSAFEEKNENSPHMKKLSKIHIIDKKEKRKKKSGDLELDINHASSNRKTSKSEKENKKMSMDEKKIKNEKFVMDEIPLSTSSFVLNKNEKHKANSETPIFNNVDVSLEEKIKPKNSKKKSDSSTNERIDSSPSKESNAAANTKTNEKEDSEKIKKTVSTNDINNKPKEKSANLAYTLDDETSEVMLKHYGRDKKELEEAKEAMKKIATTARTDDDAAKEWNAKSIIKSFNASDKDTENAKKSVNFQSNKTSTRIASLEEEESIIRVSMLQSKPLGEFKANKKTTFKELRQNIEAKTGTKSWQFQDVLTKRPLQHEEQKRVLAPNTQVITAELGLDVLISDSTIHGKNNMGMNRDGSLAFRVLWWDNYYHVSRRVWLRFDRSMISVTGIGGSFKLFDMKTMRVPLSFASVKGSQLAFQFMKGKGNMASRFFATTIEQKRAIGIYFCFIWRPQAVRRGLINQKTEIVMDAFGDEDEPRNFANLLRRHVIEVDSIIRDIERTANPLIVQQYIKIFYNMLSGNPLADNEHANSELSSLKNIKERIENWRDGNDKKDSKINRDNNDALGDVSTRSQATSEFEFFDAEDAPFISLEDNGQIQSIPVVGDGESPLPPPLPPSAMVQKPFICPINFEGISAVDIAGTIWADMALMTFKEQELKTLENNLRCIFGRDSRNHKLETIKSQNGVLEDNRIRNVEILLHIEEFKSFNIDDIVEMIKNMDDAIFTSHVLDRLGRIVNNGEEKVYSFLPTEKESQLLLKYEESLFDDPSLPPLRTGELLFLSITKHIPDCYERFEFGGFIVKYEEESVNVTEQLAIIVKADTLIRESEKFKFSLKVLLEILNILMPRFGLTRGFKISSIYQSVERVTGSALNTNYKEEEPDNEIDIDEDSNLSPGVKRTLTKAKAIKNLAKSKKQQQDFWIIHLMEYMCVYLNKFETCQGFWETLLEPCQEAMNVDQVQLDTNSANWIKKLEEMKIWYDGLGTNASGKFVENIGDFLSKEEAIVKLRQDVLDARTLTEGLWLWIGERMGSEPQLIFSYVYQFCNLFGQQWNSISSSWNDDKIKALRGVLDLKPYIPPDRTAKSPGPEKQAEKIKKSGRNLSQSLQEVLDKLETPAHAMDDVVNPMITAAE